MEDKKIKKIKRFKNNLYVIELSNLPKEMTNLRGKWGYFYEIECNNINILKKHVNKKFQTMTFFGFEKENLKKFILKNNLKGIDRMVPIGQAHNLGMVWDGFATFPTFLC